MTEPRHIDADLVRRLIDSQFPEWRDLAVRPVPIDGWDNRTFVLGDSLTVRLPSAVGYELQVRKELHCLPLIAVGVSLPVPEVVALGRPDADYPFEWSVRRWIDGIPARDVAALDRDVLAVDLAAFLLELRALDTRDGPPAGAHSAGRGDPLSQWDHEVAAALKELGPRVDAATAWEVWDSARATEHAGPPEWFHGDIATGNVLTTDGRLSAVIDFGCAGVGDPSCDLAIAWASFDAPARAAFRDALSVSGSIRTDDPLWARGSGWALWKALITVDHSLHGETSAFTLEQLGVELR